jgi:hypothetical protein
MSSMSDFAEALRVGRPRLAVAIPLPHTFGYCSNTIDEFLRRDEPQWIQLRYGLPITSNDERFAAVGLASERRALAFVTPMVVFT